MGRLRRDFSITKRAGSAVLSAVALVTIVLFGAPVLAGEALQLMWEAPAGCPSGQSVEQTVDELLGMQPHQAFRAAIHVQHVAADWIAELVTEAGSRSLRGASCAEVAQVSAVVIALAMAPQDTELETPASAAPRAPPVVSPARSAHPRPVPSPAAASARNQSRHQGSPWFGASLNLLADAGLMPQAAVGAAVGVRLSSSRFFGQLSLLAFLPREQTLTQMPSRGGQIGLQSGALRGCGTPRSDGPFFGCLGLELGRITGTGTGVAHSTLGQAVWVAPSANLLLRLFGDSDLHVEAELGLIIPLFRPEFGLDGVEPVYRPSAVSGRTGAGISWR